MRGLWLRWKLQTKVMGLNNAALIMLAVFDVSDNCGYFNVFDVGSRYELVLQNEEKEGA